MKERKEKNKWFLASWFEQLSTNKKKNTWIRLGWRIEQGIKGPVLDITNVRCISGT